MDTEVSRREFIEKIGKGALIAAMAAPLLRFDAHAMARSAPVPMAPITLDLTKPEYAALAKAGGAIKVPNPHDKKKPIIVSRISDAQVAAFSSKCTHWGCEVSLPAAGVITCPCHDSQFDASGKVLKGPARKNLSAFAATLNGPVITIADSKTK